MSKLIFFCGVLCFFASVFAANVETQTSSEVCFAPDEPCAEKLAHFIQSAEVSIDMAIYDINLEQVVHALLMKSKKIKVRIVVDKVQAKGKHSLVSTLVKAGVQIRFGHQRGIMHNKFVIVDAKKMETGSFNFTHHAALANQENQLYLADPVIVERYQQRFAKIWSSAKSISP